MRFALSLIVSVVVFTVVSGSAYAIPRQIEPSGNPLTIPRYKMVMSPNNPDHITLIFGDYNNNYMKSEDGGNTWPYTFEIRTPNGLDYHSTLFIDNLDNIYIADIGDGTSDLGPFFRKIDSPARTATDFSYFYNPLDFGMLGRYYGNIIANDSNNVWYFSRTSNNANGNVRYKRSTNGGQTWSAADWVYSTGALKVRIGSFLIENKPAVIVWDEIPGGTFNIRYYLWDENSNQFTVPIDSDITLADGYSEQRAFNGQYINGQIHIAYADINRLVHKYKDYNDGSSIWNEIELESITPGLETLDTFSPMFSVHGNDLYMFYALPQSSSRIDIVYRKWDSTINSWDPAPGQPPTTIYSNNGLNKYPSGPPIVNPSADYIPVMWQVGGGEGGELWFDTIPAKPQGSSQYADCGEVPLGELGGKTCSEVNSCQTLNLQDRYYLMTSDVNSAGTCFDITANNITLNLNEYTITYVEDAPVVGCSGYDGFFTGYGCSYGIQTGSVNNLKITNGNIRQSPTPVNVPTHSEPIILGTVWDFELSYLNISYYSDDTAGIRPSTTSGRGHIHHNNLTTTAMVVSDRCFGVGVLNINTDYASPGPGSGSEIHDNRIIGGPHMGIRARGYDHVVYNNYVRHNTTAVNGYGIAIRSYNGQAYNNTIEAINGRGIVGTRTNITIYNNFVNVTERPTFAYNGCNIILPLQWSTAGTPAHGIKTEDFFSGEIYGNTVYSYAASPAGAGAALDVSINFTYGLAKIYNNTFVGYFPDRTPGYQGDQNFGAALRPIGENRTSAYGWEFYDNTFMSNHILIRQGEAPPSGGFNLTNNKFVLLDSHITRVNSPAYFAHLWAGYNFNITNSTFINISSDNYWIRNGNYFIRWFLTVNAIDGGGSPLVANVSIEDSLGSIQNSVTGANGLFSSTLPEFERTDTLATDYSPYNVSVTYGGELQWRSVALDQSKTETFIFSGVSGNPDVNSDGKVNIIDLALVAFNQGNDDQQGDWSFFQHLDVNQDGTVDVSDVLAVIANFGL